MDFAFLCSAHLFFLFIFPFLEGNIKWHAREMKWAPSFVKKIFFPLAFVMLVNFPPFLFNSGRSLPNGERKKREPAKNEGEFKFQISRRAVAAAAVSYKKQQENARQ